MIFNNIITTDIRNSYRIIEYVIIILYLKKSKMFCKKKNKNDMQEIIQVILVFLLYNAIILKIIFI